MKGKSSSFEEIFSYCCELPVIDCHDHSIKLGPKYTNPIQVIVGEYFLSDLAAATSEQAVLHLLDNTKPWQEKWPILEEAWSLSCHTGFAEVTRRVLKKFYNEEEVTFASLQRLENKLINFEDLDIFDGVLEEAKIVVRLLDVWPNTDQVLDGTHKLTPRGRLVIPLPAYHRITNYQNVQELTAPVASSVTSLDEYLDACLKIFKGYKKYGAVAFKDQSAYSRALNYTNPPRAEAEKIFNKVMADPLHSVSYPDGAAPLDDFLFHSFLRMARDLELPVQIHTGHLAGLYGDVRNANAIHLTSLLMLHRDVKFDIFHANWPYSGELLFLCKAYPNVSINFCWTNIIDPIYCQELFRQALSSIPHSKIHAFGSDFGGFGYEHGGGYVDRAWAHLQIARENIAIALSDMVEIDYISLENAKLIARAWLFDNPNRFYSLGLQIDG